MKKLIFCLLGWLVLSPQSTDAFCGFYVARADVKLVNHQSEVILVRDGRRTVITMSSDFQGDVKDFAMVVPVPVVLGEHDIRIANQLLFDRLEAYSGPRIVEYFDQNPCYPEPYYRALPSMSTSRAEALDMFVKEDAEELGVTIEASYTIGEYDILILSAKESTGLKTWLVQNGYQIPKQAEEVLDPYIRNNLKFFVVKVNLQEMEALGFQSLRPIQMQFESDRFMLPLRLGMANAEHAQDMIVYAFTRSGRIEATNYRTVKVPTNRDIPLFVQQDFGRFYKDVFDRAYEREQRKAVFLEYAWDVSPRTNMKCDPCVTDPPVLADFKDAGADWVSGYGPDSDVFFTRLRVRYTRDKFPQDLLFQVTPNRENFQARYVTRHPAKGDLSCAEGGRYINDLARRRQKEVDELASLAGWRSADYNNYIYEFMPQEWIPNFRERRNEVLPLWLIEKFPSVAHWLLAIASIIGILAIGVFTKRLMN